MYHNLQNKPNEKERLQSSKITYEYQTLTKEKKKARVFLKNAM